jgi:4-aminobutyrate aminotransferase-like enzyme
MWHSSCNFGYRNPNIESAVRDQLDTLPQVSGDFLHEEKLLLAKEVCDAIYKRTGIKGRVSFNVGGTLVVEDALKIVRKRTGKNKVAVMMGAYHGRSLTVSGMSSSYRYRQNFGEFADRAIMLPFANCSSCFYDKNISDCNLYCGSRIRKTFENEFYGISSENSNEIGAFFLEICQGRGYTIPPLAFYNEFVPELKKRDILVVADEIQVGMYRTGKLFAFEHYGITPDIITLSKSFTNGLSPLSLVWAREDLVDPEIFGPGHAHSNYANHSLGTAAALATWKYMMAQDYEVSVPDKGAYFLTKLQGLKEKHDFIHSVDGLGLLLNIVFARKDGTPYVNLAKTAVSLAQDNDYDFDGKAFRLILNSGGYSTNVIKLAPYLDINTDEIDRTISILDQIFTKLAGYVHD